MVQACGAAIAGRRKSRRDAGHDSGSRRKIMAATRSPSSLRRESPISARGSNSSSPNPPANSAKALFPWIAKSSPSLTFTATIAFSLICVWPTTPNKAQDAAVAALEKAGHPVVRITLAEHLQSRPGIFPLGNCHRGCRLHHRHQRVQSTRRRSQQNRNQKTHQRIRKDAASCPPNSVLRRRQTSNFSPTKRTLHALASGKSLAEVLKAHLGAHRSRRLFRRARLHHR